MRDSKKNELGNHIAEKCTNHDVIFDISSKSLKKVVDGSCVHVSDADIFILLIIIQEKWNRTINMTTLIQVIPEAKRKTYYCHMQC